MHTEGTTTLPTVKLHCTKLTPLPVFARALSVFLLFFSTATEQRIADDTVLCTLAPWVSCFVVKRCCVSVCLCVCVSVCVCVCVCVYLPSPPLCKLSFAPPDLAAAHDRVLALRPKKGG